MYAIIELGGRQWKVELGTRLDVNRLPHEVGAQVPVERVLLAQDGTQTHVGRPYVLGARIICEVLEHRLGPKEISYHFRRRENWRKTVGHRQPLTRLIVKDIVLAGEGGAAAVADSTLTADVPKAVSPKTPPGPKATARKTATAAVKKPAKRRAAPPKRP